MQVLQEYVPDLLLLNGHKCHIRAHVLASGALTVWLSGHCLVLPAVKPFDPNCGDDPLVHVTNHAVWKQHQEAHSVPASAMPELDAPCNAPVPGTKHVPQEHGSDSRQGQKCPRTASIDEPFGTAAVTLEEACRIWLDHDEHLHARLHELECEIPSHWDCLTETHGLRHCAPGTFSWASEAPSTTSTVTGPATTASANLMQPRAEQRSSCSGADGSADQRLCQVPQQKVQPASRASLLQKLLMHRIEAIVRVHPACFLGPASSSLYAHAQHTLLADLACYIEISLLFDHHWHVYATPVSRRPQVPEHPGHCHLNCPIHCI